MEEKGEWVVIYKQLPSESGYYKIRAYKANNKPGNRRWQVTKYFDIKQHAWRNWDYSEEIIKDKHWVYWYTMPMDYNPPCPRPKELSYRPGSRYDISFKLKMNNSFGTPQNDPATFERWSYDMKTEPFTSREEVIAFADEMQCKIQQVMLEQLGQFAKKKHEERMKNR